MLCRAVRRSRLRAEATCVARIVGLRSVAAIFRIAWLLQGVLAPHLLVCKPNIMDITMGIAP